MIISELIYPKQSDRLVRLVHFTNPEQTLITPSFPKRLELYLYRKISLRKYVSLNQLI